MQSTEIVKSIILDSHLQIKILYYRFYSILTIILIMLQLFSKIWLSRKLADIRYPDEGDI